MTDLNVLANELDAVSNKWYTLGKNLLRTSDHHHLDSIRTQYPQNFKFGLREMVSRRMQGDSTYLTWSDIVAAVRLLGDFQLADHLETKYCSSELITTQCSTPINNNDSAVPQKSFPRPILASHVAVLTYHAASDG